MNTTYSNLQSQIESTQSLLLSLQEQANQVRDEEKLAAIEEIKKLISVYDIKSPDIFAKKEKKESVSSEERQPKYKNPNPDGKDWSGKGAAPEWIRGKNKEDYLNPLWKGFKSVASKMANAERESLVALDIAEAPQPLNSLMPVIFLPSSSSALSA